MSIGLALKAFVAVLSSKETAQRIRQVFQGGDSPSGSTDPAKSLEHSSATTSESVKPAVVAFQSSRSDALTLLSTLQREARFLDLVGESLDSYDDAQVGAAAREVIRDCRKSLDRMFAISSLDDREEGTTCKAEDTCALRTRIIGNNSGTNNSGVIVHRGWKASQCAVPVWTGAGEDQLVLAPVEIEVGSHANR